jgi:sugar transferase (PEP-CTERM/EpsH1 system associated)
MSELLFLSHRVPYPPNKGEKIRAWHILTHLAKSHRVHLGCLADDPSDYKEAPELLHICATIGCYPVHPLIQKGLALSKMRSGHPLSVDFFQSRKLQNWVAETFSHHPIDRVFVFSSAMAAYVAEMPDCIRILDMVDVDSEKWNAYVSHHRWPLSALYRREARALLAFERRVTRDFDMTLFVSEAEAQRFAVLAPECREHIGWLENGVDLETFSPSDALPCPYPEGNANIVFTGTMDYWPNVDAVTRFVEDVFPLVRRQRPDVQFHIVGANPTRTVLRLGQTPGVRVTGRVPDIRPFLAHANAAVAPLRIARGIQNKVLEAMAMARPVVATSEAFEGINASPGQDLLVANGSEEMARFILEVLEGQHPGLGAAGRKAVERHHCWRQTLRPLDELLPVSSKQELRRPAHMVVC